MAASLQARFGEKVEVTPGSLGQFDVTVDDSLLFSKKAVGRFPEPDEVEERFTLLRDGKDLPPPEPKSARGWFAGRLISKLRG